MRVLVCESPGKFKYKQNAIPVPRKGEALLRVRRIGVCGTDLHAFEGTQPYFTYPRILGHELAGEIVEGSDAGSFHPGDRVTFLPYFSCGHCIACRKGRTNCCSTLKVCGVHVDGGMADYLVVPTSALIDGGGLSSDSLALVEPMAIGAHGVSRAAIEAGEFVLVVGAGPIGLCAMVFALMEGATVIALDINESRLTFCTSKLKVHHTINASACDVSSVLKEITSGEMPTVVIDASGSSSAINRSFQYMAHGARYILIGLQKENIVVSHPEFHKREGTLMSSRNATRHDFEKVIQRMKDGSVDPTIFVTHRVAFSEAAEQFPYWLSPSSGVVKAMIELN